jgi:AcrR family transcriptional regulator
MDRQPSGVALTWGIRPERRRGPKPSLTVDVIAATAVALADDRGLGEVTMVTLAERLGCTKMALYRYVPSKADLVRVMFDAAVGEPPHASLDDDVGWRERLSAWADALLDRYGAHPWLVDVPLAASALTRNQARWLEAALGALRTVSLPVPDQLNLVLLVNAHVAFTARLRREASAPDAPAQEPEVAEAMAREVPRVSAVVSGGHLGDGDASGPGLEWGLRCILDGAEAAAVGRTAPRPRRRRARVDR